MKKFIFIFLFVVLILACFENFPLAAPRVKAAILYNLSNGKILYQLNPKKAIAPASLTKIMTMFITMDAIKNKKLKYNQKIPVSREAAGVGGSALHINAGDKIPVVRLLSGMAVASGNDAAMALAIKLGGNVKHFTEMMNAKARSLGMKNTQFKNPTGLPAAGQKTTAADLLLLCEAYLKKHPQAMRFHKMLYFLHKGHVIRNTNPLLGVIPGVDGLKTGWTIASGYNLIVTAQKGKNRFLVIILGGANKRARDEMAINLLKAAYIYPKNPELVSKYMRAR